MKTFVREFTLFFSPVIIAAILFVITDPFQLFYYTPRVDNQNNHGAYPDFETTSDLIAFGPIEKYNSFVFGNSRGAAFLPVEIEKRIKNSKAFKIANPGESFLNMEKKAKLIQDLGLKIENAFIVVDDNIIKNDANIFYDQLGRENIHHPLVSNRSWVDFYYQNFYAYLYKFYFIRDLDYRISGEYKPYMVGYIIKEEDRIAFEKDEYVVKGVVFPQRKRAGEFTTHIIGDQQKNRLSSLKSIFDEENTKVYIIIPPLYNQERMHPKNITILTDIFGGRNIYDFSGINSITQDSLNYYGASHFKIEIANQLLDSLLSD